MAERADELDSWITNWERQCIEEVERAPDLESQIQNERDTSSQKLWLLFQNSATCVAQLYKGIYCERPLNALVLWMSTEDAAVGSDPLAKACRGRCSKGEGEGDVLDCVLRVLLQTSPLGLVHAVLEGKTGRVREGEDG